MLLRTFTSEVLFPSIKSSLPPSLSYPDHSIFIVFALLFFAVDCEKSGMADMVFEMIQDADIDTRAEYYKHIVLSGMCVFVCCVCLCVFAANWCLHCVWCDVSFIIYCEKIASVSPFFFCSDETKLINLTHNIIFLN